MAKSLVKSIEAYIYNNIKAPLKKGYIYRPSPVQAVGNALQFSLLALTIIPNAIAQFTYNTLKEDGSLKEGYKTMSIQSRVMGFSMAQCFYNTAQALISDVARILPKPIEYNIKRWNHKLFNRMMNAFVEANEKEIMDIKKQGTPFSMMLPVALLNKSIARVFGADFQASEAKLYGMAVDGKSAVKAFSEQQFNVYEVNNAQNKDVRNIIYLIQKNAKRCSAERFKFESTELENYIKTIEQLSLIDKELRSQTLTDEQRKKLLSLVTSMHSTLTENDKTYQPIINGKNTKPFHKVIDHELEKASIFVLHNIKNPQILELKKQILQRREVENLPAPGVKQEEKVNEVYLFRELDRLDKNLQHQFQYDESRHILKKIVENIEKDAPDMENDLLDINQANQQKELKHLQLLNTLITKLKELQDIANKLSKENKYKSFDIDVAQSHSIISTDLQAKQGKLEKVLVDAAKKGKSSLAQKDIDDINVQVEEIKKEFDKLDRLRVLDDGIKRIKAIKSKDPLVNAQVDLELFSLKSIVNNIDKHPLIDITVHFNKIKQIKKMADQINDLLKFKPDSKKVKPLFEAEIKVIKKIKKELSKTQANPEIITKKMSDVEKSKNKMEYFKLCDDYIKELQNAKITPGLATQLRDRIIENIIVMMNDKYCDFHVETLKNTVKMTWMRTLREEPKKNQSTVNVTLEKLNQLIPKKELTKDPQSTQTPVSSGTGTPDRRVEAISTAARLTTTKDEPQIEENPVPNPPRRRSTI